ncbi:MAG: molybdopterin converting factor [Gammaproteobacteria bacterium]|nr:MAG: molybdopterin converting factor [Gammaproteobacteria bacterium]
MAVLLLDCAFSPYQHLEKYQKKQLRSGEYGAAVTFVGSVRDLHDDFSVQSMTIECYDAMAKKEIEKICDDAACKWSIGDSLVVHRYGEVEAGEVLVLVAVWSLHRQAAFEACRYIIHHLKYAAPFWKQEHNMQGSRWLDSNSDDKGVSQC